MTTSWSLEEIAGAVDGYFQLVSAQKEGAKLNKSALYRELAARFPARSAKAFEYKFQNISAVLYELKRPYADGLKPMGNYQAELKTYLLSYLKSGAEERDSAGDSADILLDKLKRLYQKGPVLSVAAGAGAVGLTLEKYLAIPQNSSKSPDFMGIELKAKALSSKGRPAQTLQTLFSLVPSHYEGCVDKRAFLSKYGYHDPAKSRFALYTSINSEGDSLGFVLRSHGRDVKVKFKSKNALHYAGDGLQEALLSKLQEAAFVSAKVETVKGRSYFHYNSVSYCKTPSFDKFLQVLDRGSIFFDLTLSEKGGRVRDHGFLWRIRQAEIPQLFEQSRTVVFD